MKKRHLDFLLKFYNSKSRQLNLLSDGGVVLSDELKEANETSF